MNLKEAIQKNKLNTFVEERKKETGNRDKFDAVIGIMAGKSKVVHSTSSAARASNYNDTQTRRRKKKDA